MKGFPDVLAFLSETKITDIRQWRTRRQELKEILQAEEYGFLPPAPDYVSFEVLEQDDNYCAGRAIYRKVAIHVVLGNSKFAFPVYGVVSKTHAPSPAVLLINFRASVPDRYFPVEEILDHGFAAFSFCYEDVTKDQNEFSTGLAGILYPDGKRPENGCGKIGMWAWAAMRVMDYLQTLPEIDLDRVTVAGHSRLGKTALVACGFDERFHAVFANGSGCSGAALSRGKAGEHIREICDRFGYWFCPHYHRYADREEEMPFDQHFLLALTAPRKLYLGCAEEDVWADPESEFRALSAVQEVYAINGAPFSLPEGCPEPGTGLSANQVGFHLRPGTHYLSREDWRYALRHLGGMDRFARIGP